MRETDVLTLRDTDPRWPAQLRGLAGMPRTLYVAGDVRALSRPAVAIVGTRRVSHRAYVIAGRIARAAAERGIVVVSGLALGVDTAAHAGALSVPAPTVAVLAHGLHKVYPSINGEVADDITHHGALVTEHPWGADLSRQSLMLRNRITSALARAVIVVETSPTGGAMHCARFAHAQGRRVVVVMPADAAGIDVSGAAELMRTVGATPARSVGEVLHVIEATATSREV